MAKERKKYLVVDTFNSYFRCIHASANGQDIEERVAFALHATLQGIAAAWRDQGANHVVMCLEGKSWRRDVYAPYKVNRDVKRSKATEREQKESKMYYEALQDLLDFLATRSNVTILQHPKLEGDDLIAGWVQGHPDDDHVIVSTDTDFYQLLAENVTQYSGVARELHTIKGIFNLKGPVIDKKTKLPKTIPNPQFILFEKCMRGDSSDFVFSAYPGVRTKGSKNKVGLIEAFADRDKQGFNWNNLMLQRWVDHKGVEHKVLDDYNRNVGLIDLTAQPADIRAMIDACVKENSVAKNNAMVGAHFLKFCGKYNLVKLSEQPATYANMLGAPYPERVLQNESN